MRISRRACAAGILLVAGGADHDRVVEGALARRVQRSHVEDINTLHLSENFQSFDTGSLLEIGGDSAGGSTRADKVLLALDLCEVILRVNNRPLGAQLIQRSSYLRSSSPSESWKKRERRS